MGTKITVTTLTGGYASIDALNANFAALADEFDKCLYRDGEAPNTWTAAQDANSQRLINLVEPTSASEPVRLLDAQNGTLLTGAILVVGTPNTGDFIVGDGGVWLKKTAAQAASLMGVGTEDTPSFTGLNVTNGNIVLGGGAAASELRILEPSADGSNYVAFKSPALGANVTFTLPVNAGSAGQTLSTDGAGVLSWITPVIDHGALTGLGDDDHPQYVLRSILTTDGDIFLRSGGVVTRLPKGADGQGLITAGGVVQWGATGVTDHGALTGLADDDHTQYVLLTGRTAGGLGQTIYGGVNASESLNLRATNHATDGNINFYTDNSATLWGQFQGSGHFISQFPVSAATRIFSFVNNAANAGASMVCRVGHNSGANADAYWAMSSDSFSSTPWSFGMDGSDSNAFVFSNNATLGTNNRLKITTAGAVTIGTSLQVTTGFGCNGATPQTAVTIGAALAAYATGAFGLDSDANMAALHADVVTIRAALVANGILVA